MSLLDTASLIVTPNAYKEGKLYSVIPSDGSGDMSVTRATTATRVNSAGLVELVPYNLAQYSEQFDNAFWNKVNVTISANSTTAPDGTLTADSLIATTANSQHRTDFSITGTGGTIYTYSCYAKANQYSRIQLRTGNDSTCNFNLSSGTVTSTAGTATATIENVGNGWYRCIVSQIRTSSSTMFSRINILDNADSNSFVGNGTDGLYIWGAQLVEGSTALPYQKTETRLNIPRLDYSNGTCPSLLVEPQRTNLILQSSSFDNAAWIKAQSTITANSTISPSGIQDADKLKNDATNNIHQLSQALSLNASTTYAFSFFAKKEEIDSLVVILTSPGMSQITSNINIDTGTVTSGSNVIVKNYGNGWYRVIQTFTTVTGGSTTFRIRLKQVSAYLGDGTSGLYLWGAQAEAGSYPTSYIPTTSASVTRNADVISKTGISSLIGQTEGTLFLDYLYTELDINGNIPITIGLDAANHAYIYFRNNGVIRCDFIVGAAAQGRIDTSSSYAVKGTRYKIAFTYKANDFSVYINGQLIGTDNIGAITGLSDLFFNYPYFSGANATSNINAAALWKTALTNDELATLTTI